MAAVKRTQPEPHVSEYERKNPVEFFRQLPEWKRKWFESKSEAELKMLDDVLKVFGEVRVAGKFTKWMIYGLVAIFLGSAAFGKNLIDIWKFFKS